MKLQKNIVYTLVHGSGPIHLDYKVLIKEKSIHNAKIKSKERKNLLFSLETELKNIINSNTETNEQTEIRKKLIENKIENIYSFKATGAQVRSRIEILENDEKHSKLFLGLEKSRQTRKLMHTLNINGEKITDMQEILNYEVQFYKVLYFMIQILIHI